jgi:uncharacterized membrane protein YvbJ
MNIPCDKCGNSVEHDMEKCPQCGESIASRLSPEYLRVLQNNEIRQKRKLLLLKLLFIAWVPAVLISCIFFDGYFHSAYLGTIRYILILTALFCVAYQYYLVILRACSEMKKRA